MTTKRGTVLFAVLLIVSVAIVIGTSVALATDARRTSMSGSLLRMQTRALAWSGVQGAMAEMLDQRLELLRGGDPQLLDVWEVTVDGRRLVVRLVPIGGERVFAVSEAARLNINAATSEMLAKLAGLGEAGAAEIVKLRGDRGIGSVEQLPMLDGAGSRGAATAGTDAEEMPSEASLPAIEDAAAGADGLPSDSTDLRALLTAFSADPNLQSGLGEQGSEFAGNTRINLNQEWTDSLADAVRRRFDDDTARFLESALRSGLKLEDDSAIVRELNNGRVPPEDWAPFIDGFTASPDPFHIGRVDINRAPAAVLACIPGFDAEVAAAIVESRGRIGADSLRNPAWPVVEGVVPAEAFQAASLWVTTRSLQWRVRVEAGFAPPRDEEQVDPGAGPLEHRTVLEAVLDLSENRPRVAYLRDITYLPVLQRVASEAVLRAQSEGLDNGPAFVDANTSEGEPAMSAGDLRSSEASFSSDSGRSRRTVMDFGDLDLGGADRGDAGRDDGESEVASDRELPPEGRDRRIGRWTSGRRR